LLQRRCTSHAPSLAAVQCTLRASLMQMLVPGGGGRTVRPEARSFNGTGCRSDSEWSFRVERVASDQGAPTAVLSPALRACQRRSKPEQESPAETGADQRCFSPVSTSSRLPRRR